MNFISIQNSHMVACEGYHQAQVRTGYGSVIAHRTSDLFAQTAKYAGRVISADSQGIVLEFEDTTKQGYTVGRRFGNAAGLTIPHQIVTPLKVGDEVVPGDVIIYNSGFFEPDFFDKKKIMFKGSTSARVVLWESPQTLEDASSMSKRLSGRLMTSVTHPKTIVVNFDQAINRLIKVGTQTEADTILCIIEDAVSAGNSLLDDQSIETLRAVSAQTPKAGSEGVVEKIEAYYHGDREDMHPSLRAIVDASDKSFRQQASSVGAKAYSGSVDYAMRINNNPLGVDQIAVKIFITSKVANGVGDKIVLGSQLKSVTSEILEADVKTESGEVIDLIFGAKSVNARIVLGPYIQGTTITLLNVLAKRMVKIYRGQPVYVHKKL